MGFGVAEVAGWVRLAASGVILILNRQGRNPRSR